MCSPDITDQWMLLFLLLQQFSQVLAHTQRISLEILFHNHVEYGQTDGTRHWVTTKLRNSKPTHRGKITPRLASHRLGNQPPEHQDDRLIRSTEYITDMRCYRGSGGIFVYRLKDK